MRYFLLMEAVSAPGTVTLQERQRIPCILFGHFHSSCHTMLCAHPPPILGMAGDQGQQHGQAGWQIRMPRAGLLACSTVPVAARLICQSYKTNGEVQACNFCLKDLMSDLALSFFL